MYKAYVCKIKNIKNHPNADRLNIGECFDNPVVIDKTYNENELYIYFPTDGQLSEEYANKNNLVRKKDESGNNIGGYLDPVKRNIKAIRLRGEQSDGLVMPLSSLAYTGVDISSLGEGDCFNVINGKLICQKYIPNKDAKLSSSPSSRNRTRKKKQEDYLPYFVQHIDTPQLRFNPNMFKEGDVICLTEKIHGTSSRNANTIEEKYKRNIFDILLSRKGKKVTSYKYVVGTRRTTVSSDKDGFYGTNTFRTDWNNKFKGKLYKGEEVFGEIAGYVDGTDRTIMGVCQNKKTNDKEFIKTYGETTTFSYGCEPGESRFFIYRMTYTSPEGYIIEYPWDLVKTRAEQMGFETVPELERFIYTTKEDFDERIKRWLDIPSTLDSRHIIEGVVIRALNATNFKVAKEKSFNFKIIEGIIKENADAPDMEEIEESS